jgi:hypothetical protein
VTFASCAAIEIVSPVRTYATLLQVYTITLIITDDDGITARATTTVTAML